MEAKDWIVMLIPLILECVVFFVFQTYFNRKLARLEKKMGLKDNVVYSFLEQIRHIRLEYENIFNRGEAVSNDEIKNFFELINPTFHFFQANRRDLEKFEKDYNCFYHSWVELVDIWNEYARSEQNPSSELGRGLESQLEICKSTTDDLVNKIRNKGF